MSSLPLTTQQPGWYKLVTDDGTIDVLVAAAGSGPGSLPAPGTPAYFPAWYALTDVYWDPAGTNGGSDANTGATIGSPLLTFAEIVRRYGSTMPELVYGQNLTIHQLSSQPANVDPVFFEPRISGGGHAALIGTPILVADIPVGGAVTAKAPGAPGVRLQVAAMPVGTVANQLVFNVTRGSWAFIDSMAVLVATMQQPLTAASVTAPGPANPVAVPDNTWATGDHLQTYTLPTTNLKRFCPVGSDVSAAAGNPGCVGWVGFVIIADSSAATLSAYIHVGRCATNVLSLCLVATRLSLSSEGGRGNFASLLGCQVSGLVFADAGDVVIQGGGCAAGISQGNSFLNILSGTTIHGTCTLVSSSTMCSGNTDDVFCDGSIQIRAMMFNVVGLMWGSYSVNLLPGGRYVNGTGSTFVLKALLTSGALTMGGGGTGTSYTAGTGLWASAIALTPAAIDGAPGSALVDPLTGAGFSLAF
jgi:hypothetical protein